MTYGIENGISQINNNLFDNTGVDNYGTIIPFDFIFENNKNNENNISMKPFRVKCKIKIPKVIKMIH